MAAKAMAMGREMGMGTEKGTEKGTVRITDRATRTHNAVRFTARQRFVGPFWGRCYTNICSRGAFRQPALRVTAGGPRRGGCRDVTTETSRMTTAELSLEGRFEAVPRSRRFVASCLGGTRHADDVELLAAELVTNAVLHGAAPVTLRLHRSGEQVRVEVEDAGTAMPVRSWRSKMAMTGRGLTLVDELATEWGVMPRRGFGKVVWAVVGGRPGSFCPELVSAPYAPVDDGEPKYEVVLGAVPTELLLAAKAHIDNVAREAILIDQSSEPAPEMAALVRTVTEDFADARTEIKLQALAAADRGDEVTSLRLLLPLSAAAAGERYLRALDEADRFARSSRLLTLASPPAHRAFRHWYVLALVDQLRAAAAGRPRPRIVPFTALMAREIDRLSALEESERRLQLLQRIAADTAAEPSIEAIASIVATSASEYPGVQSARVYVLTPERTLRSIAWAGRGDAPDDYGEFSIDADLPGAKVARSGRSLMMRSARDRHQAYPRLDPYFHGDHTLHIAPLRASRAVLGVLAVWFAGGELADEMQSGLVQALADPLAQAIERAQATEAVDRERGRDRLLLTAQVDVLADIVTGVPLEDAFDALLIAVEGGSSDGMLASVMLVDDEGLRLRYGAAPSLPADYRASIDGLEVGPRAGSCGTAAYRRAQVIVTDIDDDSLWNDLRPFATRAGLRACWSIPVFGEDDELLGTFALYYPQPRVPGSGDLALMSALGRLIAMAIERSRADQERDHALAVERAAALTLQHGISSAIPAELGPLRLAARYRTGDPGVEVGGDWYDAVAGSAGTFLIVGDVQGHDLHAASIMGQLRTAARVVAADSEDPAALLGAMSRYLGGIDDELIVTALVVWVDSSGERVSVASAGHPPPVLLTSGWDGYVVRDLAVEPGPPLGIGAAWTITSAPIDRRSILLLYTDGLVETRTWPIDRGLCLLHQALAGLPADADLSAVLDTALEIMPIGSRGDDVAVLAAAFSDTSP
jgi:GAF domain-containing protein